MTPLISRAVLDTNVCLDLLLFRDPRTADLLAALQSGEVTAVTNTACRDEWLRVLHYPQLRLSDDDRAALRSAFDSLICCLPEDVAPATPATPLPRCKDPDDQKFLQLAQSAGARWLISRDQHVLALGRRTQRDGLFAILPPQALPLAAKG